MNQTSESHASGEPVATAESQPPPSLRTSAAPNSTTTAAASATPPAQSYCDAMKSKGGLVRLWRACTYTRDGFAMAFRYEHAFRQEIFAIVPLLILAAIVPVSLLEKALLAGSLLLILAIELLNSGIEVCVDYISTDRHPLAKRAKDIGSAAVSLAILNATFIWLAVFAQKLFVA